MGAVGEVVKDISNYGAKCYDQGVIDAAVVLEHMLAEKIPEVSSPDAIEVINWMLQQISYVKEEAKAELKTIE